jgi:putative transposase
MTRESALGGSSGVWRTSCRGWKKIGADAAYQGKVLADWCRLPGDGWELEIVEREPGTRSFTVPPRRWVVERSLAWISRYRRLAKDYERMVPTSETLIELAATRLVLLRHAGRLRGPIPLAARW